MHAEVLSILILKKMKEIKKKTEHDEAEAERV